MNYSFRWILAGGAGLMFALFLLRLVYSFAAPASPEELNAGALCSIGTEQAEVKNYASVRLERVAPAGQGAAPLVTDQKYERVASIGSVASDFDADEARIRAIVKAAGALIQTERRTGMPGARCLYLTIGAPPEKFDETVEAVRAVGSLLRFEIVKTDKTNEYRELRAKRESLEKMRAALLLLKARPGKIEEYVELEDRILKIESEIQALGVNLGEFDAENEFCTVQFSLAESGGVPGGSILNHLVDSVVWTAGWGTLIAFGVLFFTLSLQIGVKLLALIPGFVRRVRELFSRPLD